jgi:hypothetical protein
MATKKGAKKLIQAKAVLRVPKFRAPRPIGKGVAMKGRIRRDRS